MAQARYASLRQVRRKAGKQPIFKTAVSMGTGDGSTTKFYVSDGYLVDGDGDENVDKDDITFYVAGSAVTIKRVLPHRSMIELESAPADASVLTADYFISNVEDAAILHEIEVYSEQLEKKTGLKYKRGNSKIEYLSGNGVRELFDLDTMHGYEIESLSVDGVTTKVENTDYWLLPTSTDFNQILFASPPVNQNKKIIITYLHGKESMIATQWVTLKAAIQVVLDSLGKQPRIGIYEKPSKDRKTKSADKAHTLYDLLNQELELLAIDLDGIVQLELFD